MHGLCRRLVAIGVAAAVLAGTPLVASAQSEFGEHVSGCAQTMGFDGTHNPGMHQGFVGWDAMHDC